MALGLPNYEGESRHEEYYLFLMLGHYSAAFTLDTYTHVTEQMKRGAAEKIGVFMNASVNVQVNVVHSPSAVVRGDYESDLANCLNPSNSTDLDPTSQ